VDGMTRELFRELQGQDTSRLLEKDPECFEYLSMNEKHQQY